MKLILGDSIKELYAEMARTLRSAAIDDSLAFNAKVRLMWSAFEETNKRVRGLINLGLLASYNEGYGDYADTLYKEAKKGRKPKHEPPGAAKKKSAIPSKFQGYVDDAMEQLKKAGYQAINSLSKSILKEGGEDDEKDIKTRKLNDFVILSGQIVMELEIRLYAAGAREVSV